MAASIKQRAIRPGKYSERRLGRLSPLSAGEANTAKGKKSVCEETGNVNGNTPPGL